MTRTPRPPRPPRLPRRRWWRRALAARHLELREGGEPGAGDLVDVVEAEYARLLADRPPWAPSSRTLTFHLEQSVGPALAVYRTLVGHGVEPAVARAEVGALVTEQMQPVLAVVGALDRLRLPFSTIRALNRWLVPRMFPAAGFTIGWARDDGDALAFDFTACFYLRLLRHYGAPELTGVFCRGDELAYERMPRTVRFARSGTLAAGAERCDFTLRPVR